MVWNPEAEECPGFFPWLEIRAFLVSSRFFLGILGTNRGPYVHRVCSEPWGLDLLPLPLLPFLHRAE